MNIYDLKVCTIRAIVNSFKVPLVIRLIGVKTVLDAKTHEEVNASVKHYSDARYESK